jgi:hypothetical protein
VMEWDGWARDCKIYSSHGCRNGMVGHGTRPRARRMRCCNLQDASASTTWMQFWLGPSVCRVPVPVQVVVCARTPCLLGPTSSVRPRLVQLAVCSCAIRCSDPLVFVQTENKPAWAERFGQMAMACFKKCRELDYWKKLLRNRAHMMC